jgi:hypothetical protein
VLLASVANATAAVFGNAQYNLVPVHAHIVYFFTCCVYEVVHVVFLVAVASIMIVHVVPECFVAEICFSFVSTTLQSGQKLLLGNLWAGTIVVFYRTVPAF